MYDYYLVMVIEDYYLSNSSPTSLCVTGAVREAIRYSCIDDAYDAIDKLVKNHKGFAFTICGVKNVVQRL